MGYSLGCVMPFLALVFMGWASCIRRGNDNCMKCFRGTIYSYSRRDKSSVLTCGGGSISKRFTKFYVGCLMTSTYTYDFVLDKMLDD